MADILFHWNDCIMRNDARQWKKGMQPSVVLADMRRLTIESPLSTAWAAGDRKITVITVGGVVRYR
jgi:hypothetical protein